jgi:hypothetical protein
MLSKPPVGYWIVFQGLLQEWDLQQRFLQAAVNT